MIRFTRFPSLKILDRYVLSEFLHPFFLSVAGFVLFMVANIIFLLVDHIVVKKVPLLVVLQMLLLRLPAILVLTFPVAMLFACLLGMGRLVYDNEVTALRTSGVPLWRISLPFFIIASFLSFITLLTNEKISPWATHKSENIVRKMILRQPVPVIEPNVFVKGPNNTTIYVGAVDRSSGILYNVMIFETAEGPFPRVTTASRATYAPDLWALQGGAIHRYDPRGLSTYEVSFQQLSFPIRLDPKEFYSEQKTPFEMNTQELKKQLDLLKRSGMEIKEVAVDFWLKFALPFASLMTCLIGLPLSVRFPKSGKMMGISFGILILFIYYALMSIGRALGKNGLLNPFLAAWLPNMIVGGVGAFLFVKEERSGK